MEYILSPYHQGVSDEELLEDLRNAAELHGRYLSQSAYKEHGVYSVTTVVKHFGSWSTALECAGLRFARSSDEMQRISTKCLITDIRRVASQLGIQSVTSEQYTQLGKYSFPTIRERFGSWAEFLKQADLEATGFKPRYEDIELLQEIGRLWEYLGRQPTTTDMKRGISAFGLDAFTRRFGGWRKALEAFLLYIDQPVVTLPETDQHADIEISIHATELSSNSEVFLNSKLSTRRTPREPNLRLRFQILQRDHFSCQACGASPAKNPSVILHIDHVTPWSLGGETVPENLNTLCETCNLGKGNIPPSQ